MQEVRVEGSYRRFDGNILGIYLPVDDPADENAVLYRQVTVGGGGGGGTYYQGRCFDGDFLGIIPADENAVQY